MRRVGKSQNDDDSFEDDFLEQTLSDARYAAQLQREEDAKYEEHRTRNDRTVLNLNNGDNHATAFFTRQSGHPITSYATSILPTLQRKEKGPEKTYQTVYGELTDEQLALKIAEDPNLNLTETRSAPRQLFDDIPELTHAPRGQSHTPYGMAVQEPVRLYTLDLSSNPRHQNFKDSDNQEPVLILHTTPNRFINQADHRKLADCEIEDLIKQPTLEDSPWSSDYLNNNSLKGSDVAQLGYIVPSQKNDLENIINIWKRVPSKNLIDKLLAVLNDYTGNNSRFLRFFSGKLNRSHIDIVSKIINAIEYVKKSENNINDFTEIVCQWTLKCLYELTLKNSKGTLATIIQFVTLNTPALPEIEKKLDSDIKIPEKLTCKIIQDLFEHPVTDEYGFNYENSAIQQSRRDKNICPFDRRPYSTPAEQEFPKNYQLQLEAEIFKAKCLKIDNKNTLRL